MTLLELLTEFGPMGMQEIVYHFTDLSHGTVSDKVRGARRRKKIHIIRYDRQEEGTGGRLIPIYAVGPGPDAKPLPALTKGEINKRYRERHAMKISLKRYPEYHKSRGVWAGLL